MLCPYCKSKAQWVENKEIYGKNYGNSYMVWLCKPCDAYVGCHNNTKEPLGTMANRTTREARKKAHKAFDPSWKAKRGERLKNYPYSWHKKIKCLDSRERRVEAYKLLNKEFGYEIHIGKSDVSMCERIVEFLENFKDLIMIAKPLL